MATAADCLLRWDCQLVCHLSVRQCQLGLSTGVPSVGPAVPAGTVNWCAICRSGSASWDCQLVCHLSVRQCQLGLSTGVPSVGPAVPAGTVNWCAICRSGSASCVPRSRWWCLLPVSECWHRCSLWSGKWEPDLALGDVQCCFTHGDWLGLSD